MKNNKQLFQTIDLLLELVIKDLKIRYRYTILGFLWIIVSSILQMFIIGMIFSMFIKINNYYLFIFIGLTLWQFFSNSVSRATTIFLNERFLLKKARFPTYLVPISIVLSNLIHLIAALLIIILYLLLSGTLLLPNILLLPLLIFWICALTLGISLLISSLYVFYRDIVFIINWLLFLGFYTTPILYTFSHIPNNYYIFFSLNPLTSILELFRFSLIGQAFITGGIVFINLLISLLIIISGIYSYLKFNRNFSDRL